MWPDRVSNPGLLTLESGALPTALRAPALESPSMVLRVFGKCFHFYCTCILHSNSCKQIALILIRRLFLRRLNRV